MPERRLPGKTLRALSGEYHLASTRFARSGWQPQTLRIVVRDGRLHTQRSGESAHALIALGDDLFRREDDAIASTVLALVADGRTVLQGQIGRAACRARVFPYCLIYVVTLSFIKIKFF